MKKIVALILGVLLSMSCLTACGPSDYVDSDGNKVTDDSKILNIMVWNSGYGVSWIENIKTAYMSKNKGIAIEIVSKPGNSGTGEIYNTIEGGVNANDTDLYFAYGPKYVKYVTGKYSNTKLLASLNEVVNYTVPGESKTIGEKIGSETLNSLIYDNQYYALTYANGGAGIVYNAKLFTEYGLTVPRTTNEMRNLVTAIKLLPGGKYNGKTPGPGNSPYSALMHYPGYWQDAVVNWWLQYEGRDSFSSHFDFSNFTIDELKNMSQNQSKYQQVGLEKSLNALYNIITIEGATYAGSNSIEFNTLQSRFLEEEVSLMYPCGGWLETEMLKAEDFDASIMNNFKIMKYPVLSDITTKLSAGNQTEAKLIALIDYVDGNAERPAWATDEDVAVVDFARNCQTNTPADNTVIVPSYAKAKDLAIDFLKFVYSDEGLKIFAESQKCFMSVDFADEAVKASIDQSSWSSFSKSVAEISGNTKHIVSRNVNHPLHVQSNLAIFTSNPERMFTVADKQTVSEFLAKEWSELMKNWNVYLASAGIN